MGNFARPAITRSLRTAAAGAAFILLLSGCGGSAGADDAETNEIRVIQSNKHDPTELGAEAGDFLDIWPSCDPQMKVSVTSGEKTAEAVAAGSADIGITSPNRVIGAISQGLDASIIGASMSVFDEYLVVRPDSTAKSFADLKGKTFAISSFGSAGDYATQKLAQQAGWADTDFKKVTMGSLDGIQAGLKSGTVDAFLWGGHAAFGLEQAGSAKVLENVRELIGPNAMTVVFASNKIIKERPEDVKAFAECYYKASGRIMDDESLATKMMVDDWGMDPKLAARIIKEEIPMSSRDGKLTEDQLKGILEATHFTIESAASLTLDDVKKIYKPWQEL
ncbi:ABC transporter substrate-binding protein [Paenarthrobacter ureafaciens]|uniref:ABC transporter substrate-binding protein n=1 Tax=Paenarthrobacter ureafaciens TaxID=37931 RepID=UPI0015BD9497|nr:ABC transporter substrate-binding protein [Paenarthrobacter ureafaciens]